MTEAHFKIGLFGVGVKEYRDQIANSTSCYRFGIDAKTFVEKWKECGPAHDCATGFGHIGSKIRKPGKLIDIETMLVC